MRKLLVTCMCGERIQVPRSALGRTGLCPSCGRALKITADNASPMQAANVSAVPSNDVRVPAPESDIEDAQLTFGKAVDHYYAGEIAQALVLFNRLCTLYPDREEIVRARSLCIESIRQATPLPPQPAQQLLQSAEDDDAKVTRPHELTSTTVRNFILHKMIHAETELARIQAAELAGRMVGLFQAEDAEGFKQAGNF